MWNNNRSSNQKTNDNNFGKYSDDPNVDNYKSMGLTRASTEEDMINLSDDDEPDQSNEEEFTNEELYVGDHILVWQGFSQRHGIVLESPHIPKNGHNLLNSSKSNSILDVDDDDLRDEELLITVVTFYERNSDVKNNNNNNKGIGNNFGLGFLRRQNIAADDLKDEKPVKHGNETRINVKKMTLKKFKENSRRVVKVRYGASKARRTLSRAGTCTCIEADERALVVARVHHIIKNPDDFLPEFKRLSANDECASVWCRTGRWITLQGASMLSIIGASHVGSSMVAAGVISQLSITYVVPFVPGYALIWSVPATVAFPFLIPLLIGYGLTSLVPLEILRRHRKTWKQISDRTNRDFWAKADDDFKLQYFASCATAQEGFLSNFFATTAEEQAAAKKNGR